MPESLVTILEELERIAAYSGPWRTLRRESELLRDRLAELRQREERLDDVLVVALVGGSGVGKSTLLNALAGDEIAKTSEYRPCTSIPTVYHPPGVNLKIGEYTMVPRSALEHLVIIDTPDSDTIMREHRQRVIEVLRQCDLILLCGSSEKYLDEATWSLLRPLVGERNIACVETKAHPANDIKQHWLQRLSEQGFRIEHYFRVNALRALDRKLNGGAASEEEMEFPALENFLRNELTRERIARIKRSNVAGLLKKTLERLQERIESSAPALRELESSLAQIDYKLTQEALKIVEHRLFTEPHLWNYVVGRETSLRAKGLVGTCYRVLETVRGLPARMAGWMPWGLRAGTGQRAASLLGHKELFQDDLQIAEDEIAAVYGAHHGEIALAFAKAGFDPPGDAAGRQAFQEGVNTRVSEVLRGPARDVVLSRARLLTSWPISAGLDALPALLVVYGGYEIVSTWVQGEFLQTGYISHTATVLAILLGAELVGFSVAGRMAAASARRGALRALHASLTGGVLAFQLEKQMLHDALELSRAIERLRATLAG